MNTDGTNQRAISDPRYGGDTWPTWSPDGKQIAFVNDDIGTMDIYVMDADGGNRRNITNSPESNDTFPAWSPVGGRIAFASDRNATSSRRAGSYLMDEDGSNIRRISGWT
ncbi:MAG: hypothetical protein ABGY41_19045, partial [Candidatus Poribacteria bacterium]